MCRIDRLAQPLVKAVCRAGMQLSLIACGPQQRQQRILGQQHRRFAAADGLVPHRAARRRQERRTEREISGSQVRSQQAGRGKAAVRRLCIVRCALPEYRKRAHPERVHRAAVFHREGIVGVVQKSGGLFVDPAELLLPAGGVGQVRCSRSSLHRQGVQRSSGPQEQVCICRFRAE